MPFDPTILLLVIFGGFVLWWMPRNARKQQAAAMAFRDSLQPGQEVLTIGRMYGTVVEVDGNRVTLELSDGVYGVWDKEGISRLVEPPVTDDDPLDDEELDDDELADDEYDDEEYDDDEELAFDDELADDQIDEAPHGDEAAGAIVAGEPAETWSEVDVPDDASSLTDPDQDKKDPR